jgi:hypothetical protein
MAVHGLPMLPDTGLQKYCKPSQQLAAVLDALLLASAGTVPLRLARRDSSVMLPVHLLTGPTAVSCCTPAGAVAAAACNQLRL